MEEILELYELQYSDLVTLLSDQKPETIKEIERLELISKSIMQNLGRDGPGLLSIGGIPKARTLAQTLLPLARKLALLSNDDRKRILKDHNLGSDVPLKNLDRIVSSFAMHMKYDHDFNIKTKGEEKISREVDGGEFKDLGFAFRELGFCVMELGLCLARVCDKLIGGCEMEQSLLQCGTAKGRLIHYHSVTDNIAIKEATNGKRQARDDKINRREDLKLDDDDAGDSNLWQQWHYDYGIFTILTSPMFMLSNGNNEEQECESPSDHTYLQVFHPGLNRVLMVKAYKGSFIVQVGESAEVLSKGRLRATLHSVCRPAKMDNLSRETFVVFLQPAWSKTFSLSDYPKLTLVDPDLDSCNEKESNGLTRKILEIVPPLFYRLRDGMTLLNFRGRLRSSIMVVPVCSQTVNNAAAISENAAGEEEESAKLSGNTFSFASSATSQLILERIMSQSEISPLTSGRLSQSSGPLNGCLTEETESPPISPSEEYEDVVKYLRANNTLQPLFTGTPRAGYNGGGASTPGGKTVGRWLKERREKKKEETRAHNAQLHAAVSVAGVASAIAAIAAATAAASSKGKDEQMAKTDMAVASAATLVAAQCVEAAETMGADRDHLMSAIRSAVSVRSHGDISTLTAAAATALRGVATLKARALKEVWNVAAAIPIERGLGLGTGGNNNSSSNSSGGYCEELVPEENFLAACNQEMLARGTELLKRTRKGDLHWKIVSVYIHRSGNVMLKMKSKHVASTITKKKKNVVLDVYKDMSAWPGRHLFEDGEQRRYFGLKTEVRGVVEFECKNAREYEMWTQGVSRLLSIVAEKKKNKKRHYK